MTFIISLAVSIAIFIGFMAFGRIVSFVKKADRQYMDPLPPLMRLSWPAINFLSHYFGDLLSVEYIERSKIKLRRAGLAYLVTAQQFFALKLLSAFVFMLMSWLCFLMLGKPAGIVPLAFSLFGFIFLKSISTIVKRRSKRRLCACYLCISTSSLWQLKRG